MAGRSFHRVPPHQHSPDFWTAARVAVVSPGRAAREASTWLKHTSLQIVNPSARRRSANRDALSHRLSTRSATPARPRFLSVAHSSTAAGAARHVRRVEHPVPLLAENDVRAAHPHGPGERLAVSAEHEAVVVRRIQGLVGIRGPGVGDVSIPCVR